MTINNMKSGKNADRSGQHANDDFGVTYIGGGGPTDRRTAAPVLHQLPAAASTSVLLPAGDAHSYSLLPSQDSKVRHRGSNRTRDPADEASLAVQVRFSHAKPITKDHDDFNLGMAQFEDLLKQQDPLKSRSDGNILNDFGSAGLGKRRPGNNNELPVSGAGAINKGAASNSPKSMGSASK